MTTFNLLSLTGTGTGNSNRDKGRMSLVTDTIIDFTSTTQPNSGFPNFTANATTLSGNASGDTVRVFNIPAVVGTATPQVNPYTLASISPTFSNALVGQYAGFEVLVADTAGNSGTISVGDSGSATRYTSAIAPSSVGFKTFTAHVDQPYTAADYIVLAIGTGAINAIVRVFFAWTNLASIDQVIWY